MTYSTYINGLARCEIFNEYRYPCIKMSACVHIRLTRSLCYLLVAGVTVFLLYHFVIEYRERVATRNILISTAQQAALSSEFARSWQRSPTDIELDDLLKVLIRKELAYREASKLALGHDDANVRRRLQHLLEELAVTAASQEAPAQEDLQFYLDENADEFRVDPLLTFHQIYFDNTHNVIGADAAARFMLGKLQNQDFPDDISKLGDPSSLPALFNDVQGFDVATFLGAEFAARLPEIGTGEWFGPIQSNIGLHLVFIDKRSAGRVPNLGEIEDSVRAQWLSVRRRAAIDDMYSKLAETYIINIE